MVLLNDEKERKKDPHGTEMTVISYYPFVVVVA